MAWVKGDDRGREMDEKLAPFLKKTWDIVEDPQTDHVVQWSQGGKSFIVEDVEAFCKEILPKSFKHSNWSSFVRQLNTYGFRKIDPDRWEFANEHFAQGGKELLTMIQRKKPTAVQPGGQQQMQGLVEAVQQPLHGPLQATAPPGKGHGLLPAPFPLDLRVQSLPLFQAGGPAQPVLCLPSVQQGGSSYAGAAAQLQASMPAQRQHHAEQQAPQPAAAPSNRPATGGTVPPPGMDRLNALVGEYLRPGQQILANMGIQQDSISKSTSTASGPSASTIEGDLDMEDDRKTSKRTRGDMNTPGNRSGVPGPSQAAADGQASKAFMDKHGTPLPPGITRPVAQPLGLTTQNLISEMAGQLGKLTQLASEVEGLREDNVQLRHGMQAMNVKQTAQQTAPAAPIHAMMAEQRDNMWRFKLKNDEVELQIAAQQQAQVVQHERSSAIEARLAQQYKMSFDTARHLEARNQELCLKLAIQENVNQSQLQANVALESRVAELESQLTGRRDELLLKGIEDRLMFAMSEKFAAAEEARDRHDVNARPSRAPAHEPAARPEATELVSIGCQGSRDAGAGPAKQSHSTSRSQSQDTGSSHAEDAAADHLTNPVVGALQLLTCDTAFVDDNGKNVDRPDDG